MISPNQHSICSVGELLEKSIERKDARLDGLFSFVHSLSENLGELFRLTDSIDKGGYCKLLEGWNSKDERRFFYRFTWTRTTHMLDHFTALSEMFPRGTIAHEPSVMEMLRLTAQNAKAFRSLLTNKHRIIFLGDTGLYNKEGVGILNLKQGKFCFDRVIRNRNLLWGPKDIFIIRA